MKKPLIATGAVAATLLVGAGIATAADSGAGSSGATRTEQRAGRHERKETIKRWKALTPAERCAKAPALEQAIERRETLVGTRLTKAKTELEAAAKAGDQARVTRLTVRVDRLTEAQQRLTKLDTKLKAWEASHCAATPAASTGA